MCDIQFKDNLRKDLITFKHHKELLESDKKVELQKAIDQKNERINASLQDQPIKAHILKVLSPQRA